MYRTLLARCEYGVCSHCKECTARCSLVWLSECFRFVPIIRYTQWVQTPYSHLASKVRYISIQRKLQLKIHLSSYIKTRDFNISEVLRYINVIWISRTNVLSLYERRGESPKHWVLSSFFGLKKGIFTSEIEISTLLRNFFLGVCGKFFRNVGVRGSDSEDFPDLYL